MSTLDTSKEINLSRMCFTPELWPRLPLSKLKRIRNFDELYYDSMLAPTSPFVLDSLVSTGGPMAWTGTSCAAGGG